MLTYILTCTVSKLLQIKSVLLTGGYLSNTLIQGEPLNSGLQNLASLIKQSNKNKFSKLYCYLI